MFGAYILIILGVALWSLLLPTGKRLPNGTLRAITVFGGAFLLAVCFLGLVPEMAESHTHTTGLKAMLPFVAVLVGFMLQQILDGLSAHAEHGHTEEGFTIGGLMLGLCLHALLEGMPLVATDGTVNAGLMWGIVIHNIPVAVILVSLMAKRGFGYWRVLALLIAFGLMSPIGSLCTLWLVQPTAEAERIIIGFVVGVLLHVSSSILFDHKQGHFSWLNIGLMLIAFALAFFIV